MESFTVTVTKTFVKTLSVPAKNVEEAEEKIHKDYLEGKIQFSEREWSQTKIEGKPSEKEIRERLEALFA